MIKAIFCELIIFSVQKKFAKIITIILEIQAYFYFIIKRREVFCYKIYI